MVWILGFFLLTSIISVILRRVLSRNKFESTNERERQIQEEDRIKSNSWFGGGGF
ncbi:hypothetical protein [Bacillus sp. 2205SS5-2]|uniref:hypothetical protein n=1 Tax=Bacillus sp. 2205SS5-2 TaxID=3109031 RepID=UPI003006EE2A